MPEVSAHLDFTVSLRDVLPRPWRRFVIGGTSTFAALSAAIQDACGWSGSHLYAFLDTGPYGEPVRIAGLRIDDGLDDELGPVPDARRARLTRYFGPDRATTCLYHYDFGDDWVHDVQLNDVIQLRGRQHRGLLGGEHPFPPDDCGGPPGYAAIQHARRTGEDPDGLLAWARETWGWTGTLDLDALRAHFDR